MKDVSVEIQSFQNGQEVSYIYTLGKMKTLKNQSRFVEFNVDEMMGVFNDNFSFTVTKDNCLIFKSGRGNGTSRFIFQQGEQDFCRFSGISGQNVAGMNYQNVVSNFNDDGGIVSLKYTVQFRDSVDVVNEMRINVQAQKKIRLESEKRLLGLKQ